PDGKFLYYAKGRSVAGLWRKSLPDGAEEEVLRWLKPGFWGYWAVCDHGVIYADRTTSQSLPSLFHLAGGGSTLFAKLGKPIMIADSGLAVTDDCSRVVVTQTDQSGSDIMLGEFGR
ncbi:MAG TPA: hypothetical protein VEQ63_11700, partial [Bryobacteraceae bacterium]|nr:hypothetical protein [Bryobacteraceae bacterium]